MRVMNVFEVWSTSSTARGAQACCCAGRYSQKLRYLQPTGARSERSALCRDSEARRCNPTSTSEMVYGDCWVAVVFCILLFCLVCVARVVSRALARRKGKGRSGRLACVVPASSPEKRQKMTELDDADFQMESDSDDNTGVSPPPSPDVSFQESGLAFVVNGGVSAEIEYDALNPKMAKQVTLTMENSGRIDQRTSLRVEQHWYKHAVAWPERHKAVFRGESRSYLCHGRGRARGRAAELHAHSA